ncbi:tRNA (N6-isopentenyl adenosine(37)-C2)-methylthiotransferase MiaB [Candidatus Binatia bacterium]|nr:tRNA (N6-isopentenyl adenosine(37)-C2)-methylthiotransferase MiaB [Candidatus Binatia bacterium]
MYIETFGCQMNLADTEVMFGHLGRHGYRRTEDPSNADVILLNTCAIREHAEARVLGRLSDLGRHKARRPEVRVGLAGCMAQHLRDRLLDAMPFLDFVVGPDAYRRLPELLAADGADTLVDVRLDRDETYADIVAERERGVRAWVTIMRGCDKFCTFCVVPYVRGRERSLPAEALLDEVRRLAADGYREVVYLGQTVNAYRHDGVDFAELLRRTAVVPGLARVRFTSPHPADMTPAVVDVIASCPAVCPQLHLPVQSGSDGILARMERGYTRSEYLDLVARLRCAIPGIALTTDVIVGFPGEEANDFAATLSLLDEVRFDGAFMFKYSARSGTRAYRWGETVSEEEKARRLQAVIALQEQHAAAINRAVVGTTVEVLVEGPARRRAGWLAGKTRHFKTCVFPAPADLRPGDLVDVTVTDSTAHTLIGAA